MFSGDIYPETWKTAFVNFITKPGGGLRPLALTSCPCKLFELMVSNRLRWWIERNDMLPLSQIGFRKGRSCLDSLSVLTLEIDNAFRTGRQALGAFLDVSGAFNNVLIDVLLDKLAKIGLTLKIIRFIRFLTYERFVYSRETMNDPSSVYRGVPQGGVLSPPYTSFMSHQ